MKKNVFIIGLIVLLVVLVVLHVQKQQVVKTEGQILSGIALDAYNSTTTSPTMYSFTAGVRHLTPFGTVAPGVFGGCIVTGAGSAGGSIEFFDATTTSATSREARLSSTTQMIYSMPTNLAAGNYMPAKGIEFNYGLAMAFVS